MVASDLTLDVDPVAYFLTGVARSILGGIVLSLVLTWLWNRRVSNGARGKGRQESE
jgi:hypothetical protein